MFKLRHLEERRQSGGLPGRSLLKEQITNYTILKSRVVQRLGRGFYENFFPAKLLRSVKRSTRPTNLV